MPASEADAAARAARGVDGVQLAVVGTIRGEIVRALLVPALVSHFGRWNWWLPSWLARMLFVEPSPRRPGLPAEALPEPKKVPAAVN